MAFCSKCGTQLGAGAAFCPSCGTQSGAAGPPPNQQQYRQSYQQPVYQGGGDAANNKAMGILAYLGILVLIPIFAAKESPFARYHANQGLVLAIAEVAYGIVISILSAIFWAISWGLAAIMGTIFGLLWLAFLALAIIGIVNASKGELKPLPVIGGITILK